MNPIARVRGSFVAGAFIVSPLAVTLFVLAFIVDWVGGVLRPIVNGTNLAAFVGGSAILAQALAAVLLAVGITLVGFVASHEAGRRLFGGFERGVALLPVVRAVYFGVRQVSESLASSEQGYDRVVVAEFPRDDAYAIGFVTNPAPRGVRDAVGVDLQTVFFPHSPNPTAGKLAMMHPDDFEEVEMSVARGLRLLVTTGLSVDDVEELPDPVAR